MRRALLIPLLLAALTLAAYWPLRQAEFLNFDDPEYVTNNPQVFRGLGLEGVGWAFTTFHAANWHPVTWLSHQLDCSLFGERAGGHHLVNVSLHIANALLLLGVLQRLAGAFWRSAVVAALFALHPLHVESVAWIAERKDVLSTFFFMLALWAYAGGTAERGEEDPASRRGFQASRFTFPSRCYCLALACFVLGLMCKPMLVTLPFVLLLLDFWPRGRLSPDAGSETFEHGSTAPARPDWRRRCWRLAREKWPFFALAAASCLVTVLAQARGGAIATMERVPALARCLNALVSYAAYLGKAVWPGDLAVFYPLTGVWLLPEVIVAVVLLLGLSVLAVALRRPAPYLLAGWLWYLGTLVPVIGVVQVGSQARADRYTYVPLIGIFIAAVWGAAELCRRVRWGRIVGAALAIAAVIGCAVATRLQIGYWRNSVALFEHAVAVCPQSGMAHHNLGHALSLVGEPQAAIVQLNESIRLQPGAAHAYYNRGNVAGTLGDLDAAIADYREALRLKPDYEQAYYTLGKALALELKWEEAKTNFLLALHYKPDYSEAYTRLGNVLLLQGDTEGGLRYLHRGVEVRPDLSEAHYFLAGALARLKRFAAAAQEFRLALRCDPHSAAARNDLAWILLAEDLPGGRDVAEGLRLAADACRLTDRKNPMYLDTLAVAYAQAGRWPEAVETARQALTLTTASDEAQLTASLRAHLERLEHGLSPLAPRPAPDGPRP